jgi:hypothetical protein
MAAKKQRPIPATPEERSAEHKRQMLLQVWLPLAGGTALVLAVCILAIIGTFRGSSEVNRWGNISAVYLIIPSLLTSLVPIVLYILAIRGMSKLLAKMPVWMMAVQALFTRIYAITRQVADKLAAPVLTAGGLSAGLKTARRKISR